MLQFGFRAANLAASVVRYDIGRADNQALPSYTMRPRPMLLSQNSRRPPTNQTGFDRVRAFRRGPASVPTSETETSSGMSETETKSDECGAMGGQDFGASVPTTLLAHRTRKSWDWSPWRAPDSHPK